MLPSIFQNWFPFCLFTTAVHKTSVKGCLHKKSSRTNNFGKFSVTVGACESWNKMQDQMCKITLKNLGPSKIKWLLTELLFCIEFCSFALNI